jgi:hypothetical protein
MADSRFFITVALDRASYQRTLQQFDRLSRKEDELKAKAAGFGTAFGTGQKYAQSEIKKTAASFANLGRQIAGISAKGRTPFAGIEQGLKNSNRSAKQLLLTIQAIDAYRSRWMSIGRIRGPALTGAGYGGGWRAFGRNQKLIEDQQWRERGYLTSPEARTNARRRAATVFSPVTQPGYQSTYARSRTQFADRFAAAPRFPGYTMGPAQIQPVKKSIGQMATQGRAAAAVWASSWSDAHTKTQSGIKETLSLSERSNKRIKAAASQMLTTQTDGWGAVKKSAKNATDQTTKYFSKTTSEQKAQSTMSEKQRMQMLSDFENIKRKVGAGHIELGRIAQKRQMALTRAMTGTLTGKGVFDERIANKYDRVHDRLSNLEERRTKRLGRLIGEQDELRQRVEGTRRNHVRSRCHAVCLAKHCAGHPPGSGGRGAVRENIYRNCGPARPYSKRNGKS